MKLKSYEKKTKYETKIKIRRYSKKIIIKQQQEKQLKPHLKKYLRSRKPIVLEDIADYKI